MLIPPYRILPSACLYVACQLFYCHQSSPPLVRTSEWARDPGPPGLLWPRPPARFRPTSGPPVPVGRPPDPGNPVTPLARPPPGRPQAPGAPAVPPARLSAYRQASARPVVFRPHTRQTPEASPASSPVAPPPTSDHPGRSPGVPKHARAPGRRTSPTVRSRAPGSPVATRLPGIYPPDPRTPRFPPWPTSGSSTPPSAGPAHAVARTRPFDGAAAPPATGHPPSALTTARSIAGRPGTHAPRGTPPAERSTTRQTHAARPLAPLQIASGTEGMASVVVTFYVSKFFLVTSECTLCNPPHALQVQLSHGAQFASLPLRRHTARVSPRTYSFATSAA